MKNFLCPVDLSSASTNAMEYAARLAKHFGASLTLLQIIKSSTLQDVANLEAGLPLTIEKRERATEEKLKEYCRLVTEEFSISCTARARAHTAHVDKALKKEIEEGNYDLVIMGTNGADNLNQFYFGTNTYKVIRQISHPLLLIPEDCTYKPLKKVVYAMDYAVEDISTIRQLIKLTRGYNPEITVLHVNMEPATIGEEAFEVVRNVMKREVDNYSKLEFANLAARDIAEAIDSYTRKSKANLLVLLNRHHRLLERAFFESTTKRISFIADYPVLIYHQHSDPRSDKG